MKITISDQKVTKKENKGPDIKDLEHTSCLYLKNTLFSEFESQTSWIKV